MADNFEIISRVYSGVGRLLQDLGNVQPPRPSNPVRTYPDFSQENARASVARGYSEFKRTSAQRNAESEAFLKHVNELRAEFDWDGATLWDARFVDGSSKNPLPKPFDKWAPFVTFTDPLFTTQSKGFELGMGSYSIPFTRGQRQLNCTYVDTQELAFTTWLRTWSNVEIHNNGMFVTPVVDAAKELQFIKLNSLKRVVGTQIYYVVPDGELVYDGQSESGSPIYSIMFNIVGEGKA